MFCPNCGNEIKENQAFCGVCGAEVLNEETASEFEANGFNMANIDFQQPKKKNKKKIIIPIFAVLLVIAIVIGVFSFAWQDKNKWYCTEKKITEYNEGEKEKMTVSSQRTDGQFISEGTLDDNDKLSSGRKYAYDDEGRAIRISFFDDGEQIGVVRLNYEKEEGNYVAEATETIDEIQVAAKRIYNSKNVLIYESMELGEGKDKSITEKEYNDKGQILKSHVSDKFVRELVIEYKYEKGKLASSSKYIDGELSRYAEYDKDGNIVKEESYSDGTLNSRTTYDWSKSKIKNVPEEVGRLVCEPKSYDGDGKLVVEINSEFSNDKIEVYIKSFDDEKKEEMEAYSVYDENEPLFTVTLNDKKQIKELYIGEKKAKEYKYDKYGNVISEKFYFDGELSQVIEYKWERK